MIWGYHYFRKPPHDWKRFGSNHIPGPPLEARTTQAARKGDAGMSWDDPAFLQAEDTKVAPKRGQFVINGVINHGVNISSQWNSTHGSFRPFVIYRGLVSSPPFITMGFLGSTLLQVMKHFAGISPRKSFPRFRGLKGAYFRIALFDSIAVLGWLCLFLDCGHPFPSDCEGSFNGTHFGGFKLQTMRIHPGRLTWNIIMEVWKIIFLSTWVICRFHVNLPECIAGNFEGNTMTLACRERWTSYRIDPSKWSRFC